MTSQPVSSLLTLGVADTVAAGAPVGVGAGPELPLCLAPGHLPLGAAER